MAQMADSQNNDFLPLFKKEEISSRRSKQWHPPWKTLANHIVGALGPILLPFIHLGLIYQLWNKYNRVVDRRTCSCSCWDTVFKGVYETGIPSYKHIYFNSTFNTYKIWIVTVIAVIIAYECGRHVFTLIVQNQVRWRMVILLVSIVYPHYYSWWSYFNYWNDEFYTQWFHQLYFTFTELMSTTAVVILIDKRNLTSVPTLLIILSVAVAHILVSGFDQLVSNVVRGEGSLHQVLRDIGLFVPDLMHITVALFDMRRLGKAHGCSATHLISNRQFVASVLFITLSWLLCLSL